MNEMNHPAHETAPRTLPGEHPDVEHEFQDVRARSIAIAGASILVVLAATALIVWGMFNFLAARQRRADVPPSPVNAPPLPAAPRLLPAPAAEHQRFRAAEDELLSTYGWVDQNAGTVRIPIDRAMELLAATGLPVRPEGAPVLERAHDLDSEGGQEVEGTPEPEIEAAPVRAHEVAPAQQPDASPTPGH